MLSVATDQMPLTQHELFIERRIATALCEWQADLASPGRHGNPVARASAIIPDKVVAGWQDAAARSRAVVKDYLARAVATSLVTTSIHAKWSDGREWNLPLVSAKESLGVDEAIAIAKFHLARKLFPRKHGVNKRLAEVPASVRLQVRRCYEPAAPSHHRPRRNTCQAHAVADADGFLSGVMDPGAIQSCLGRRVLLLLALLLDKGIQGGQQLHLQPFRMWLCPMAQPR